MVKDQTYVFTRGCGVRQLMFFIFCLLLVFIDLVFLVFQYTPLGLLLTVLMAGLSVGGNLHLAKFYEIRMGSGSITIENIWKKTSYPLDQLADIQLVRFNIFQLTNRSLIFYFKDGKKFRGTIPNAFLKYFQSGGLPQYVENLKIQFLSVVS
jgi:hypothetical protein